ncbi:hypothetical protein [Raoultibacter massiliensis]|uniref:DUF4179 domain-containing protein n=1 Tax=Raoultibacter massiliensis TaxID=1852371 RepID=A0ABV1J8U6_9ACTN|nr:hypothetical protein [Raoultibacter massiliensis]
MKRNLFDDYRDRMSNVALPETARARIDQAIQDERASEASEVSGASTASIPLRQSRPPRRPIRRFAVAAACVVAVVLGGILLAPTAEHLIGVEENSFTLTAYAYGTDFDGPDNIKLALGDFASWGGFYSFDESDWKDSDPYENDFIHDTGMKKGYICSTYFDLACEGTGIEKLTYELEGDGVYFNFDPARDTSTAPEDFSHNSFSVEPGDLKDPGKGYIYIVANVSVDEDLAEPTAVVDQYLKRIDANRHEPLPQAEQDAYNEAHSQLEVLVQTKAAEAIGNATLAITATYSNGTTETHSYRIAPVDDFAERYQDYVDGGRKEDRASFFVIEQLD